MERDTLKNFEEIKGENFINLMKNKIVVPDFIIRMMLA